MFFSQKQKKQLLFKMGIKKVSGERAPQF